MRLLLFLGSIAQLFVTIALSMPTEHKRQSAPDGWFCASDVGNFVDACHNVTFTNNKCGKHIDVELLMPQTPRPLTRRLSASYKTEPLWINSIAISEGATCLFWTLYESLIRI